MISEEALEAATAAVFANVEVIQTRGYAAVIAKLALEAAAPYTLAQATAAIEDARAELERRRTDFEQAADKLPNPTDAYGMNQREWLRTVGNPYRNQS